MTRNVSSVRGNFVGDNSLLHIFRVRQSEMFLRRDVAQHRRAVHSDHRGANRAGDVIVAGRDVGHERPERVEGRLAADLELAVHILLDLVHRHMAGAFDHHLHVVLDRKSVV